MFKITFHPERTLIRVKQVCLSNTKDMSLSKLRGPLSRYITQSGCRVEITEEIWERYGAEGAVMVLDMAGFSITTRERGIIYYLALINEMQSIVEPIVKQNEGQVVKFESDNGFLRFPDTSQAVAAANMIQEALRERNEVCPDEFEIRIACGIDFGRYLLIDEHDFYGDPVNCASKLGEDLADAGEVLVSRRAWERLGDSQEQEMVSYAASNMQIEAVRH